MLLDCLKCRRKTKSKNPSVTETKKGRIMLLLKCALFDSKRSILIKNQETKSLLNNS